MVICGRTDIGQIRETNQDTFASATLAPHINYALVCDGMGGANGGNVASQMARDVITNQLIRNFRENMDENFVRNLIITAISHANTVIYEKAQQELSLVGMGTTVVLAIVIYDRLYIGHVGDSRAYLIHENQMDQLTRDHSVVQMMVEQGELTPEQAKNHPRKNQITRAVGAQSEIRVEYNEFLLNSNDKILLCTDGLTNSCNDSEILETVYQAQSAKEACDRLIQLANRHGGKDNITVMVIQEQ